MKLTFMDTLMLMTAVTLVGVSVLSSGCDQPVSNEAERSAKKAAPLTVREVSELEPGKERFKVEFHGTFNAGFDNNRRDILIIHDLKTKRNYLGITGVGVSELHSETTTVTTVDGNGGVHVNTSTETKER